MTSLPEVLIPFLKRGFTAAQISMFRDEFVRRRKRRAGEAFIGLLGATQTGTDIYFHQDWRSAGSNRLSLHQSLTG